MSPTAIDQLGNQIAHRALVAFATFVRQMPDAQGVTIAQIEAASAAMKAASPAAIDRLLNDAKNAPWVAEAAATVAVLTIAHAGIAAFNAALANEVAGVVDIEPFTLDGEAWQARVGKGPGAIVLTPTWNSRGAAIAGAQVEVRRLAARGTRLDMSVKTRAA